MTPRDTRLTRPLVRDDGELRPATWDEALDRAASGLRRAIDQEKMTGVFSCSKATNELNFAAQKFSRVALRSNNIDSCNRTRHAPSVVGLATVFGAGGGTSSYEELRETSDLIVLWGSNARDAHPIFFHRLLKALRRGAKVIVVDPRRTSSAQWADLWLGLDDGTDIPLANAIAREVIHAGFVNEEFVARATENYDVFPESVEPWTLEEGERVTGVPAAAIRELAHAFGGAANPQLCWTLGITEHHNAVDNVFALINLSLLVGGVGRYGAGLQPLRGQNNVQGGGDMGAIPNKLPGFQDVEDPELRGKFDTAWDATIPPKHGLHLTGMF